MTEIAIVHDYLTQRGGAERVVVEMLQALPEATLHTSLLEPSATFDVFAHVPVRRSPLDLVPALRRDHRLAFPLLAPAFSAMSVDADVVLCSSSGWAHGVRTDGRKVVYCYTPARWLYQTDRYLGEQGGSLGRVAVRTLGPALRRWDRRAADSADVYVAISTAVRERIRAVYERDCEVLPPAPGLLADGPESPVDGVPDDFVLCVSRLLPYKNVDAVVAGARLAGVPLVVVGRGPEHDRLSALVEPPSCLRSDLEDAQLRWLYRHASVLVHAAYEDFGLTPLEAYGFGTPAAVLRFGGTLDTTVEGLTGTFFDTPDAASIAAAIDRCRARAWDAQAITDHARSFGPDRFRARLRELVDHAHAAR